MIINLQGSSSQNSSVGNYDAHIVGVSGDQIELAASLSKVYGENDNSDLVTKPSSSSESPLHRCGCVCRRYAHDVGMEW